MKKIFYSFLLLFTFLNSNAQQKNFAALNLFSPVFGTYQLHYERKVSKKMSVGLGFAGKFSSGIFEIPGISSTKINTDDFNFKGIKIIPEFRWYLSPHDNGISGFYMGSYYKYQNYNLKLQGTYTDNSSVNHDLLIDTSIISNIIGLEIGYKLIIQKRFFVDFIIAGPGYGINKLKLNEISPIPEGFYSDLSDEISEYEFLKPLNIDVNLSAQKREANLNLPAFRYGILVGFNF